MSGYFEFSKSNNARIAEADGKYPAIVLAERLKVNPKAIRALLRPCEWHHTSKFYNVTDYFNETDAIERIEELKAWQPPVENEQEWDNCRGSYLEWSGTRKHPHAKEINFGPVKATKKGKWFTLHLPGGVTIRKGEATRGFHLYDCEGHPLTFNL